MSKEKIINCSPSWETVTRIYMDFFKRHLKDDTKMMKLARSYDQAIKMLELK